MIGKAVIVIVAVALTAIHPLAAAIVLVTVYVAGVLPDKFTSPVNELILNPAGVEVNAPATPPPENAGAGFKALEQYGLAG